MSTGLYLQAQRLHSDWFVGILSLEVQKLKHEIICHGVVNASVCNNNPPLQQVSIEQLVGRLGRSLKK